jgi:peptide/nickel transport system permease protein
MSEAQAQSPLRMALGVFMRGGGARFGVAVLAVLVLIAIYAPFIAGEVALVWVDKGRISFPVITDLFNANSFRKPHELLFNTAALFAPFMYIGWRILRRRCPRFPLYAILAMLVAWIALMIPVIPQKDGSFTAVWKGRGITNETFERFHQIGETSLALFPSIPLRYDRPYVGQVLKRPLSVNPDTGTRFWLGTDASGKDVLSYLIFGARISLTIGLFATAISMAIGILIGGISGYFGGKVDMILQRIVEIMMCFPTFILVLVVVAMTRRDIFIIMLVLGLTGWAGIARLVRGEFLAQSVRDYVVAGEALGLPRWRIMFRHILPNVMTPLLITATFSVAGSILAESGLAFIGLGDPTAPSWGMLLDQGRSFIRYAWIIYAPGVAVFLLVTALNLIGNGLSEALDPRRQR